ncbi:hypothetical protein AK812_SmicGene40314 [Symbiodinium microadriaticum]|uniref:Uncharacterized protein n=1 Tax=Symbiodinium microadriaticum TaxID=2951 RepID=A0A1Q9C914_SYMMI|nr:hypothetical protein AK812_SmicGene40314 [Symbiodinium microadriaticum]
MALALGDNSRLPSRGELDWALYNRATAQVQAIYGAIEQWNVAKVTDMSRLFDGMVGFNEDISAWNTSQVTTMSYSGASGMVLVLPMVVWLVECIEYGIESSPWPLFVR